MDERRKRQVKKQTKSRKKSITISSKNAKTLKLIAIIFVVLLLVALAAGQFGGVTFSTISDNIRTAVAGFGSGDGYPYRMNGIEITDAGVTNSDLILVYDDTVKVLDSTAKELSNISHTYDHPVMSSNSGRALIYDVGAKTFRVQSKTRVLYEKELPYMILTGAMGKDGTVAIASRAKDAQSMLTVYNTKEEEIFVWKCAKENIISCDVSDNGRLFAVTVLGVDNGSVYSKVYIFNKNDTEPEASFEYMDSAVSSVQFLSNETLFVFGNNICQVIKGDKVKENIDVSVNTPYKLYISDNNTAVVVLSKYSSTTQKIIKVYDKSGSELFTQEIDGLVKSVSTDGKYTGVLTDENIQIYNKKGKLCGEASVNTDSEKILISGRNTYVYSADKIEQFSSVKNNNEVTE
ncbi:MAG: hypothetical protein IJZ16_07680 [Clostridia bacterium]|nr:hypothetical protein [Clostridia bacterium]